MSAASSSASSSFATDSVVQDAINLFVASFGEIQPGTMHVGVAPGRVNLIGEHTDYNDGFVMPLAIERHCVVVGRRNNNGNGLFRMISRNMQHADDAKHEQVRTGVDPHEGPAKKRGLVDGSKVAAVDTLVEFDGDSLRAVPGATDHTWHNYVRGVIAQYANAGHWPFPSFDVAISSSVPLGGGLSSSAALEMSFCMFLQSYLSVTTAPIASALLCQAAEHQFAHVPCGIMDQFISVAAIKDHCLLIDCRANDAKPVSFSDPNVALIITNTNVKHALSGGEYGIRRSQCEAAVAKLKSKFPEIKALRDATLDQLISIRSELEEVVFQRAMHVITENDRTIKAANCLSSGDYATLGKLMTQSHISLKNEYEVSCVELDVLVDAALALPGVYGARMTGGGFGGCTITLVNAANCEQVIIALAQQYHERTSKFATTMITRPSQGARHFTM